MKLGKKLAALVLALMMALSVMAVTAAAYGEEAHVHDEACCQGEVVARRPPVMECPVCFSNARYETNNITHQYRFFCLNCGWETKWVDM